MSSLDAAARSVSEPSRRLGGLGTAARCPEDPVLWSTAAMACAIALGPRLGVVAVAVAALAWFGTLGWYLARRIRAVPRDWWGWLALAGTSLAVLRMTSLGWVQWMSGRETLFWNVDWRYSATQAHSIARFGGSSDSTDYAGAPIEYHAGPSWIAGSLRHVLELPVNRVLFVVVPGLAMLLVACIGYRILVSLGVRARVALLAVAVVVNLPAEPLLLAHRAYQVLVGRASPAALLNAELWWFSSNLMLNALLGLAVGLLGLWALMNPASTLRVVAGSLCMASLIAIKPQYLVGFVFASGIGYLVDAARSQRLTSWRQLVVLTSIVAPVVLFSQVNSNGLAFSDVSVDLAPLVTPKVLLQESLMVIAAASFVACTFVARRRGMALSRLSVYATSALLGWAVLYVGVTATTVLLDVSTVRRAQATGLLYARDSQDFNFQQVLRPVELCVVLLVVAGCFELARRASRTRVGGSAPVGVALALALFSVPVTLAPLVSPEGVAAYEVADDADLSVLMSTSVILDGVWISSDLADPAQNYARPLRAVTLTASHPAQFYVTNVAYGGLNQEDVAVRIANTDRFFSTAWSGWHDDFLLENDIKHVLVRDRCPAAWGPSPEGLRVGRRQGTWTRYEVTGHPPSRLAVNDVVTGGFSAEPRYGRSDCRGGGVR